MDDPFRRAHLGSGGIPSSPTLKRVAQTLLKSPERLSDPQEAGGRVLHGKLARRLGKFS